jgi:hypothetical protein
LFTIKAPQLTKPLKQIKMSINKNTLAMSIITAILFTSCGGGNSIEEKVLTANNISVSGDGSQFIKVIDGDYTLRVVGDKVILPIKLELAKSVGIENTEMGNLSLIPIDKSGVAVPDIGKHFSPATMSDWGKTEDLLNGEKGKTAMISFEWSYHSSGNKQARIMEETESFELTRADITGRKSVKPSESIEREDNDNDVETDDDTISSDKGSEDWDIMLDDYEEYVDEYIKFYKKAMKGDNSAMAEFPAMLEKASNLQTSMANAQSSDELSISQIERMMRIQTKMTKAAMDL